MIIAVAIVLISAACGAAIGYVCDGSAWPEFMLSIFASLAFATGVTVLSGEVALAEAIERPAETVMYHIGPFVVLYFLPMFAAAMLVGQRRRK